MIDLHSHVLPGIDDGPSGLSGAVALGRAMARDGTEIVAATPHLRYDHPNVLPTEIGERCGELNREFAAAEIRVRVVPSAEVDLQWALDASEEDLRLASYAQRGAYILLETPYAPLSANFEDLIFRVFSTRGFGVVLAHPERSRTFQRHPDRLAALVRRGVLVQITALALLSKDRRSRSAGLARALVKEGLAHVLASDAHSHTSRRGPSLAAGLKAAIRISPARARWMVGDAPAAILAGDPLPPAPPATRTWRKRSFSRTR